MAFTNNCFTTYSSFNLVCTSMVSTRITNKQNDGKVHGTKIDNMMAFFTSKVLQPNLGDHLAQITNFKFKSKISAVSGKSHQFYRNTCKSNLSNLSNFVLYNNYSYAY